MSKCGSSNSANSAAVSSRVWYQFPLGKVRRFGVLRTRVPVGLRMRAHSVTNRGCSQRCSIVCSDVTRSNVPVGEAGLDEIAPHDIELWINPADVPQRRMFIVETGHGVRPGQAELLRAVALAAAGVEDAAGRIDRQIGRDPAIGGVVAREPVVLVPDPGRGSLAGER